MRVSSMILCAYLHLIVLVLSVDAAEIKIPCEYVTLIEISKTPPGLSWFGDFSGSCSGENCFIINLHLSNDGKSLFHEQVISSMGLLFSVYVGEKLVIPDVIANVVDDIAPPLELFSKLTDMYGFTDYVEAEERAFAICPGKIVKYTGTMWQDEQKKEQEVSFVHLFAIAFSIIIAAVFLYKRRIM